MTYQVEIAPAAKRQIKKLTLAVQRQVIQRLEDLGVEPRPVGVTKLEGSFISRSSGRLPDYLCNSGCTATYSGC